MHSVIIHSQRKGRQLPGKGAGNNKPTVCMSKGGRQKYTISCIYESFRLWLMEGLPSAPSWYYSITTHPWKQFCVASKDIGLTVAFFTGKTSLGAAICDIKVMGAYCLFPTTTNTVHVGKYVSIPFFCVKALKHESLNIISLRSTHALHNNYAA